MEEEKRNMMVFFVFSIFVIAGYHFFFDANSGSGQRLGSHNISPAAILPNAQICNTHEDCTAVAARIVENTPEQLIEIDSNGLSGSISSRGGKFDNINLKGYNKNLGQNQEKVPVFGPTKEKYYANVGWYSDDPNIILPNENSCWKVASVGKLSEKTPIIMTWDNKNGLLFERKISVDDKFLITITDNVLNYGKHPLALKASACIYREFNKNLSNTSTSYEGPIGCLNNKVEEISYEDIEKKSEITHQSYGGWFGIGDKYWLVAFIPEHTTNNNISYKHRSIEDRNAFSIESRCDPIFLTPSSKISHTQRIFVGAKELNTLDMYGSKLGVSNLDLAIDFGCLYLLTKPLLYVLAILKDKIGNMGVGILLLTLLIKLLLIPLANRSYRSMNRMKEIQPKIQALQKRYADDKVKLGQEISAIYKKEGVSPVGGCLPMLLQSPVLFALYKVLYISIEMRHAPFCLWIHDLSLPDPMLILNLFGLLPFSLPGFLQVGIWPLLMGLSMFLQQKIGPEPADPAQANMMLMMPIIFTFMFAQLPSGLVIYWTFSNVLSIAHQYFMMQSDEKNKNRNPGK